MSTSAEQNSIVGSQRMMLLFLTAPEAPNPSVSFDEWMVFACLSDWFHVGFVSRPLRFSRRHVTIGSDWIFFDRLA